jgi:hypothetical protein
MKNTYSLNIIGLLLFVLSSCATVEKSHCGSSRHSDRKKIKKLKSNPGFKMVRTFEYSEQIKSI